MLGTMRASLPFVLLGGLPSGGCNCEGSVGGLEDAPGLHQPDGSQRDMFCNDANAGASCGAKGDYECLGGTLYRIDSTPPTQPLCGEGCCLPSMGECEVVEVCEAPEQCIEWKLQMGRCAIPDGGPGEGESESEAESEGAPPDLGVDAGDGG